MVVGPGSHYFGIGRPTTLVDGPTRVFDAKGREFVIWAFWTDYLVGLIKFFYLLFFLTPNCLFIDVYICCYDCKYTLLANFSSSRD